MNIRLSQHLKRRNNCLRGIAILLSASTLLSGCGLFSTDIENVNVATEDKLEAAEVAPSLANGLGGAVLNAVNGIAGVSGAASDELQWSGSREYWNLLDGGDIGDPINEYSNGTYPYISQARWQSDFVVAKLEAFDKTSTLVNRADLARAYIYAGTAYLFIGENYEDFIITSERTEPGASIGEANMRITHDSAIAYFSKALALATTLSNAELRRQALGMRARARFSRAVWGTLRAPRGFPANPLISDAGASADASAALALMTPIYRFRLTSTAQNSGGYFNTGFEMNQRLELRAGTAYANGTATRVADGLAGIKLTDPVTGQPDATLAIAIDECCRLASTQFLAYTLTSAREMYLILAEAALATANTSVFTTNINAARAIDSKAAWGGSPSAKDILIHERRVGLFMQARRLTDHYRFNQPADRWLANNAATRRPCFIPISFDERTQNKLAPQPAQDRPTACKP